MIQRVRQKIVFFIAGIVLLVPNVHASLAGRVNAIVGQKQFKNVQFGVHIVDVDSGSSLYKRNSKEALTPASNMKIVASAAVLRFLGPDYKFTTEVCLLGNTLVVIGGGDPLIGDEQSDLKYGRKAGWFIDAIIDELKGRGKTVLDEIIIDSTFFDDERVNADWPKDQLNRSYACEVSGLNYNRNCVKFKVFRDGSKVRYSVLPATGYLSVKNQVKTVSSGSSAVGAYRNHKPNFLTLKGKCRTSTTFDVAIEEPAMFFGTVLKEKLVSAGIKVKGGVDERYVKKNSRMHTIMRHQTPLSDVLARCNKDSLNLAAEALVKTLSAEKTTGRINGEWEHGLSLIGLYMTRIGVDADEFKLVDGSGLSKNNKLSPRAITTVLMDIYASDNWPVYKDSLSIGGVDGTGAKYFAEQKYKGRIFAKSGYINSVRAYSGYIETSSKRYIFSILTKGGASGVRGAINDIVKAVIDESP